MLTTVPLASSREQDYEAFLLDRQESLFYHSLKYRNFLKGLLKCEDDYVLAVNEHGEVRGALPLMWIAAEDGRRIYNSLPYYGSNGAVIAADSDARRALISEYSRKAQSEVTIATTMVENPLDPESEPPRHNLVDERISQITVIPKDMTDIADIGDLIDPSARRNIRKAANAGFTVLRDASFLPELHRLHSENMSALGGLAKTSRFFELIPRYFVESVDFNLYVALLGDDVAAALLVFYFNGTVEYFTPAVAHSHRSNQPLSLILSRAIVDASQRQCVHWNWGGTWKTQQGVHRFKRKWGATDRRYRYYTQLNDRNILSQSPSLIRRQYPNFFVVPFSALEQNGAE